MDIISLLLWITKATISHSNIEENGNGSYRTQFSTHLRRCMDARYQPSTGTIILIVLQKNFTRLLIEGRFRVWVDKKALYSHKDVTNAIRRLPIFLQCIHADFTGSRDIRMKYLCCKAAYIDNKTKEIVR